MRWIACSCRGRFSFALAAAAAAFLPLAGGALACGRAAFHSLARFGLGLSGPGVCTWSFMRSDLRGLNDAMGAASC